MPSHLHALPWRPSPACHAYPYLQQIAWRLAVLYGGRQRAPPSAAPLVTSCTLSVGGVLERPTPATAPPNPLKQQLPPADLQIHLPPHVMKQLHVMQGAWVLVGHAAHPTHVSCIAQVHMLTQASSSSSSWGSQVPSDASGSALEAWLSPLAAHNLGLPYRLAPFFTPAPHPAPTASPPTNSIPVTLGSQQGASPVLSLGPGGQAAGCGQGEGWLAGETSAVSGSLAIIPATPATPAATSGAAASTAAASTAGALAIPGWLGSVTVSVLGPGLLKAARPTSPASIITGQPEKSLPRSNPNQDAGRAAGASKEAAPRNNIPPPQATPSQAASSNTAPSQADLTNAGPQYAGVQLQQLPVAQRVELQRVGLPLAGGVAPIIAEQKRQLAGGARVQGWE